MTDLEIATLAALVHDLPALSPGLRQLLQNLAPALDAPQAVEAARRAEAAVVGAAGLPLVTGGLRSVWGLVSLTEQLPSLTHAWQPVAPLAPTAAGQAHLFPVAEEPAPAERSRHLEAFTTALRSAAEALRGKAFPVLVEHLLALLQQYLWCVPAHSPDVALFDHLKLAAAVAACQASGAEPAQGGLLLTVGDLSGIQDYIFDIASVGAGGVARRLRARSLYVALISDVVTHRLLREFSLSSANVLASSGGKFYLLLPAMASADERLGQVQDEVDRWLLDQFTAEIGLNLVWVPLADGDLQARSPERAGFANAVGEANARLAVCKRQRLRVAAGDGGWRQEQFVIARDFGGAGVCRSCGKRPAASAEGFCIGCLDDAEVGQHLPRARYLCFYRLHGGPPRGPSLAFLDRTYVVPAERPPTAADHPYLVVRLNDPDLAGLRDYPASFRYLANHVPHGADGGVKPFGEIAAASEGRALLGHLKADVDRLGALFAFGLCYGSASYDSAAHQMLLSRELDLFFSGWLQHRLEAPASAGQVSFGDFYTVFSGGDDLYLIGPWDRAMPLAQEVRATFARFVGGNPHVTLSAGILLARDHYPIARAARDVEQVLEHAKEAEGGGRNRLAVLGDCLRWDELPAVLREAEEIAALGPDLTSALLHDLVEFGQAHRAAQPGDVTALRHKARFAYNLARGLHERNSRVRRWADQLLLDLNEGRGSARLQHLALAAACVLYRRRSREDR